MSVVLDAGALIALERNDRAMWGLMQRLGVRKQVILVPTTVISQCWRTSRRQARLHAALDMCTLAPFDPIHRRIGELLGRSRTSDVCDAHVVLTAMGTDAVFTSDPEDLERLMACCDGASPEIVVV